MDKREIAYSILENCKSNTISSFSDVLCDFNRGEIGMLNYLISCDELPSAGYLSEKLEVSTARIARILNSLEDKGCIKRCFDAKDKRKTIVEITDVGKNLVDDLQTELVDKICLVIENLGEENTLEYLRISKEINNILSEKF